MNSHRGTETLAHQRLQHLYEISKLFASFETAEQPLDPALGIVTKTLPLRSAILIQVDGDRSTIIFWPSEGQNPEEMRVSREHAEAAYSLLVGTSLDEPTHLSEQAGVTRLPRPAGTEGTLDKRFIVIPLVVARHSPFGVLQLEGARPLDESDLMFVNAIANQLAIALHRDRAWRRDITRRQHAEEGQIDAETRGAKSERGRIIAESSSEQYEALARENSRLYEQAQRAVRAREQILAIVSHDLKNPLGTILLTIDVMSAKGSPLAQEGMGRIQRAAARMLRLIEDLLDFASIEAGRLGIQPELQDPRSMIHETLAAFENVAQEKGLELTAEVEPALPNVFCDRGRILQVLANLVGNATKVTAAGGHVALRVEARGDEVLFAVSDTGAGISEGDVKHLFERYWRSEEANYKGTGLGLAIANGIVRAHDGKIWVESKLGQGTTFFFTLPRSDGAGLEPARVVPQQPGP